MDSQPQLDAIRGATFVTDFQTKAREVVEALAAVEAGVIGSLRFEVNGVPVVVTPEGENATVNAGSDGGSESLYTWQIPFGWIS